MPAGNENYNLIAEDRVRALIAGITEAGAQKYVVEKFFGTFSPEELYGFIRGKLNAAHGTVFIRASDDENEPRDTVGTLYTTIITVEVLVAYPALAEKQYEIATRKTDEMATDAKAAVVGEKVTFSDQSKRIYYRAATSLLKTDELDAQLVRFRVPGVSVDFNLTI